MSITLVDPNWIKESGSEIKIIDTRRLVDYTEDHIQGAISIPVTSFVKSIGRLKDAPDIKKFEDLMNNNGINNDSPVIAYDDQMGVYASRFLWTLDLYGHKEMYILDRNFSNLKQSKNKSTRHENEVKKTKYSAKLNGYLASLNYILKILKSNNMIIDAGDRMDFLNGHIPNAVNIPWKICVGKDRNFLPKENLNRIFEEHGVFYDKETIVYCKDGMTSSYIYAALRMLGHKKLMLYSRGYAEWEDSNQQKVAEFQELLNP